LIVATLGLVVLPMLSRGWHGLRQHRADGESRHEQQAGRTAGGDEVHCSWIRMMVRLDASRRWKSRNKSCYDLKCKIVLCSNEVHCG
jgi:hypothetical protein